MLDKASCFTEVKYPNLKDSLTTHGYDNYHSCARLDMYRLTFTDEHVPLIMVKQVLSQSMVLSRILALAHHLNQNKNIIHDNTCNQLRGNDSHCFVFVQVDFISHTETSDYIMFVVQMSVKKSAPYNWFVHSIILEIV